LSPDVVAETIDEIPILAILATRVAGGVRFAGAGDLRKKESDRIATVAEGLRRMGAVVRDWEDGFEVDGPVALRGAEIDAHGDHRIAMAFACAALVAEGETTIVGANAVDVSFPEFFDHLPAGASADGAR
jgi:3-phosphoshikimate 1-carboxyvinyltransferase